MPIGALPTGSVLDGLFWLGLVAATASDLRLRKVPNALNGALALAGVAAQLVAAGLGGLGSAALGLLAGFALVIVPFALRLYRGGNAKLVIALGAWLGPHGVLWGFLWGTVFGAVVAFGVLAVSGRALRGEVRRNLERAALTGMVPVVEERRPARQHVPMALAFSAGAAVAVLWR